MSLYCLLPTMEKTTNCRTGYKTTESIFRSLSIKPDVQYVVNPGGDGRDALLAGVRIEFSF